MEYKCINGYISQSQRTTFRYGQIISSYTYNSLPSQERLNFQVKEEETYSRTSDSTYNNYSHGIDPYTESSSSSFGTSFDSSSNNSDNSSSSFDYGGGESGGAGSGGEW